jgi:hypothetical protein
MKLLKVLALLPLAACELTATFDGCTDDIFMISSLSFSCGGDACDWGDDLTISGECKLKRFSCVFM